MQVRPLPASETGREPHQSNANIRIDDLVASSRRPRNAFITVPPSSVDVCSGTSGREGYDRKRRRRDGFFSSSLRLVGRRLRAFYSYVRGSRIFRLRMQSSLPTTTATRPMHRDLVASQNVMSGRLYVVGSQQQRRDVMRHNAHMGSSASWYALYQRLLRYVRRLLSRRREIEFDEMDFNPPRYRPDRINALCRLTNFSRNEIKLMYQGFKQVCPTGIVNENTFKDIFSSYFPQGDATQYAHYVFKACDQEKNGTLNFQEFVQGLSMLTRGSTEQKLRWTFNLYDIDGDGRITRNEMREIISSVYQMLGRYTTPLVEDNTAQQHADKVFQKLDQNQDGYVTFEEFLETCQKDENIISSLQLLDTVL